MINKIISDGCDYESGGGFDCFLIVLIRFILFASRYSPAHQRVGQSIARSLDLSLALSIAPSQGARHKKESANRVQTGGGFFHEHGLWQKDSKTIFSANKVQTGGEFPMRRGYGKKIQIWVLSREPP